jgi:AraC-like DNA-binding protein
VLTIVEFIYNFVVSTLVGIFGLHLLFRQKVLASKFLGGYFIIFCFRIILAYFATGGRLAEYPHLYLVGSPIHFLAPPVAFLFVYYMLHPSKSFVRWHAILFLPFLLHFLELLPFYFGPVEKKVSEIQLVLRYKSLVNYPGTVTFLAPMTLSALKMIFTTLYALLSISLVILFIRKNTREFYVKNRFLLNWLVAHSSLAVLSTFFIIAYVTGLIGFNNLRFSYSDLLMHLAAFVNLTVVLYRPALLDGVSFHSLVLRLQESERQPEAEEDGEKLKKYESYAARLEELFARHQVFLDPDLTLEKVGSQIQVSTKELSRTTAYIYQLSFPDFVNSWRINYILEQRKQVEAWRNYSQDLLAEQAGFGSRQGLNNAVNRLHDMTPAAYFSSKD